MMLSWRNVSIGLGAIAAVGAVFLWQSNALTGAKWWMINGKSASKELSFKWDAGGIILNQDGFKVSVEGFRSSDGIGVSYYVATPVGSERPIDAFRRKLAAADYVVGREIIKDPDQQVLGERAVILFRGNGDMEVAAILWANVERLNTIESLSLRHALEFEKQLRK